MKDKLFFLFLLIASIEINADWKLLGLEKDSVLCIAIDESGKIIAGTKSGGIKIYDGKEWFDVKKLNIPVNDIMFTRKNRFIAAIGNGSNADGVYSANDTGNPPYYKLSDLPFYGMMNAQTLAKTDNSDTIYMGGGNTIVYGIIDTFSGNYIKFTLLKTPLNPFGIERPKCAALQVFRDEDNRLYAGGFDESTETKAGQLLWMSGIKDSMPINATINVTSISECVKDDGGSLLLIGTKDSIMYYCSPRMSVPIAKFFIKSPKNEPINDMVNYYVLSSMRSLVCAAVKSGVYADKLFGVWLKVGNIPATPLCLDGLSINVWGKILSLYAGTTSGVYKYDSSTVVIKNYPEDYFVSCLSIQQYRGKSISVSFTLPRSENVHLDILNCAGKNTAIVFDGYLNSGKHTISWDVNTKKNIRLGNGVYILRLFTEKKYSVKRFVFAG
jgi:hypothetical protein